MTKILAKVQEIQAKRLGLSEDKDGEWTGEIRFACFKIG